jgi:ATP-binding cassette, subfamily F, member 3
MIQLTGAGKRFGPRILFEELDWLVTPQARVGLVGSNGTGKSTLLKVLGGLETLDYGTIVRAKGLTTGYLPQDGLSLAGKTLFAECMSVFDDLRAIEHRIESLAHQMSDLPPESREYANVADEYQRLEAEFRTRDGYALDAQVGSVLAGLGFRRGEWSRPCEDFSGGWQMRIAMAKLLLQKPNLLLLDEPTNHLDLEARNWLEGYLRMYPHAFLLVSHDRFFLDVTVNRTAEIWNQRVHFYSGNYDSYLSQKQQQREQLEAAYRNQKERIEQLESFINRFRAQATKAKQVQSRIKELERIERIQIPPEEKTVHFSFPQPGASGRMVAEAIDIAKTYSAPSKEGSEDNGSGGARVFDAVQFVIERGDRIALTGANGAGKSTLIKMLAGLEAPTRGAIRLGHNVQTDYFAQDQYRQLDPAERVLDDLWALAPNRSQTELRNLLGCFLFSADDVFKPIGVLSGGERNRYALARMLLHPANFLLLDEPTNHLDLRAKDVLLESLLKFTGTVVFVSHDRYFIDKLATRIFEVGGGTIHDYRGNYEDYVWQKEHGSRPANGDEQLPVKLPELPALETPWDQAEVSRRINPQRVRQLQERCGELEEQIARVETEIAICEDGLTRFVSAEQTLANTKSLGEKRTELESLMREWEQLAAVLESQ